VGEQSKIGRLILSFKTRKETKRNPQKLISSTVRSTDSRTVPDLFVCKSRRLIVILLIFLSVSSVCLSRRHSVQEDVRIAAYHGARS